MAYMGGAGLSPTGQEALFQQENNGPAALCRGAAVFSRRSEHSQARLLFSRGKAYPSLGIIVTGSTVSSLPL